MGHRDSLDAPPRSTGQDSGKELAASGCDPSRGAVGANLVAALNVTSCKPADDELTMGDIKGSCSAADNTCDESASSFSKDRQGQADEAPPEANTAASQPVNESAVTGNKNSQDEANET